MLKLLKCVIKMSHLSVKQEDKRNGCSFYYEVSSCKCSRRAHGQLRKATSPWVLQLKPQYLRVCGRETASGLSWRWGVLFFKDLFLIWGRVSVHFHTYTTIVQKVWVPWSKITGGFELPQDGVRNRI